MSDYVFTREDVRDSIKRTLRFSEEKLEKFKNRLDENDPLYAFEWGEEAIGAAAHLKTNRRVIKDIDDGVKLIDIIDSLKKRIMGMARWPKRSTSQLDNHCHSHELSALSEALIIVEGFYKSTDEYEA